MLLGLLVTGRDVDHLHRAVTVGPGVVVRKREVGRVRIRTDPAGTLGPWHNP